MNIRISPSGSIQPSNLCNNCESVEAEYTCDKCENVNFCPECYNTVHMSPIMQKHQQLSIDQKQSEISPCRIHPKKKLECWCHTCATVICIDCLLFEHKNHKYASIDDVAKDFEAKVSSSAISRNDIM